MRMRFLVALALASGLVPASRAGAELAVPRVSQHATVEQTIGTTELSVVYCRPGVKGRTIWGTLVPYDAPWRTGANEATTFTTTDDIMVEGKPLAAGTYSFFTIPGKDGWTMVFNKGKDLWGAQGYKQDLDALRVPVKALPAESQEWMRFSFENLTPTSADLVLRWEKLSVPMHVAVDVPTVVLTAARREIAAAKPDDWRTSYRAATYAFELDSTSTEAKAWAEHSVAVAPTYQNLSLVARMHARSGRMKDAISSAERAIALGKASKDSVDTAPTETLLAGWKGTKK